MGGTPDQPDPLRFGIEPVGSTEDRASPLVWLQAASNPFHLPVLDCRSITRGSVSTMENQTALDWYIALREDPGESLRTAHPSKAKETDCALRYPIQTESWLLPQGRCFSSPRLEYKWDLSHWDGALFFHRSWTGELVYRASIVLEEKAIQILKLEISEEASSWEELPFHVAAVDFLIKTYLFQEQNPHPLPSFLVRAPEKTVAFWSLKYFGCDARYGFFLNQGLRNKP